MIIKNYQSKIIGFFLFNKIFFKFYINIKLYNKNYREELYQDISKRKKEERKKW
jgi:hypothetical protein